VLQKIFNHPFDPSDSSTLFSNYCAYFLTTPGRWVTGDRFKPGKVTPVVKLESHALSCYLVRLGTVHDPHLYIVCEGTSQAEGGDRGGLSSRLGSLFGKSSRHGKMQFFRVLFSGRFTEVEAVRSVPWNAGSIFVLDAAS
jgi:hypothetical protein